MNVTQSLVDNESTLVQEWRRCHQLINELIDAWITLVAKEHTYFICSIIWYRYLQIINNVSNIVRMICRCLILPHFKSMIE